MKGWVFHVSKSESQQGEETPPLALSDNDPVWFYTPYSLASVFTALDNSGFSMFLVSLNAVWMSDPDTRELPDSQACD